MNVLCSYHLLQIHLSWCQSSLLFSSLVMETSCLELNASWIPAKVEAHQSAKDVYRCVIYVALCCPRSFALWLDIKTGNSIAWATLPDVRCAEFWIWGLTSPTYQLSWMHPLCAATNPFDSSNDIRTVLSETLLSALRSCGLQSQGSIEQFKPPTFLYLCTFLYFFYLLLKI